MTGAEQARALAERARITNVLEWGIATSHHRDASIEGWAEQIQKVLDSDRDIALSAAEAALSEAREALRLISVGSRDSKSRYIADAVLARAGEEGP